MDIITYALAKKIGSPSEAQIESAVDNYLDAHPEATTTVQDGSITKAKLNAELSGEIDEISDINDVFVDFNIENLSESVINACKTNELPLEVYAPNTEASMLALDEYVSGATSDILNFEEVIYNANIGADDTGIVDN